jgi:hypothetical protein
MVACKPGAVVPHGLVGVWVSQMARCLDAVQLSPPPAAARSLRPAARIPLVTASPAPVLAPLTGSGAPPPLVETGETKKVRGAELGILPNSRSRSAEQRSTGVIVWLSEPLGLAPLPLAGWPRKLDWKGGCE